LIDTTFLELQALLSPDAWISLDSVPPLYFIKANTVLFILGQEELSFLYQHIYSCQNYNVHWHMKIKGGDKNKIKNLMLTHFSDIFGNISTVPVTGVHLPNFDARKKGVNRLL
jgi:hypothetical protein